MIYEAQAAIAVGTAGIAAYIDWKTGLIPNRLTYPAIGLGIVLLALQGSTALYGLGVAALVYAMGFLLYKQGQLGGGDVKLLTGIALLLPYNNSFGIPHVFNILITASLIMALTATPYYCFKYLASPRKKEMNKGSLLWGALLLSLTAAYAFIMQSSGLFSPLAVGVTVFVMLASAFYSVFGKDLALALFAKPVPLSKVELGDVLVVERITLKQSNSLGLSKGTKVVEEGLLSRAKKLKLKSLWIYSGLPRFGPALLAGTIVVVFYPDWVSLALS